jgi:hypothetical protein
MPTLSRHLRRSAQRPLACRLVLATDLGQTGNPSPANGLRLFVTELMKAGVSKDQIAVACRETTGKLLMG